MAIGFSTKEEELYERKRERNKLVGEWVVIYTIGMSSVFAGQVKGYDTDRKIVLNPYQGGRFDEHGVMNRCMREEDSYVPLEGAVIEISDEESIRNAVKRQNLFSKEDFPKREGLLSRLLKKRI